MSAISSLLPLRPVWIFLLLWLARASHAAEPTSMMSMTDKQFAEWVVGTEWTYTYLSGQTRKVWFVSPDVCVYTRVGDDSTGGLRSFPWNPVKKGSMRFLQDRDPNQPRLLTLAPDLKTATLTRPGEKDLKVEMTGRRTLGASFDMTTGEFTDWLRDIQVTYGSSGHRAEFPERGKIHITEPDKSFTLNLEIIRPGVVCYRWEENPLDPLLLVFSQDLKTVRSYMWHSSHEGKVVPANAGKETASAVKDTSDGRISMDNLKSVPLLASGASVKALLVRDLGNSKLAGSASLLSLSALPLQGDAPATLAFNQDVGKTMSRALREVARCIALRHGGWPRGQEMQLSFEDKYGAKDGPSAAAACALLLDSLITGVKLTPEFAVTGDLNADGSIQPIGGVQAKLRGATRLKCSLLGIPSKNASQATDIALTEGPKPFMDVQVFTLANFDETLALGREDKTEELASAIRDFAALLKYADGDARSLRGPESAEKLRSILKRAPNHFSARILLLAASGKLPKNLSPAGTLAEVDQAVGDLKTAIGSDLTANTKLNSGQIAASRGALLKLRPLADPRVRPLLDAWAAWGNLADRIVRGGGTLNAKELQEWRSAGTKISVEEEKLRSNEAFSEELE